MKLFSENNSYKLYEGNMLDMLEVIEPNSIDSIVTDPPYELNFMNKGWDNTGIAFQPSTWLKCLEVLKPGGYLLAFGGSRTFHRIACAIEDAGFEIRDTIMWLYVSGFPKSMNLGKTIESKLVNDSANTKIDLGFRERAYDEDNHLRVNKVDYQTEEGKKWGGWGTALKPSYEPIIVARKPFNSTLVDNVLRYGVGGYNIDECRIGTDVIKGGTMPDFRDVGKKQKEISGQDKLTFGQIEGAERLPLDDHMGRFPTNTIFDDTCNEYYSVGGEELSRYFYCAKASKKDRDEGLDAFKTKSHEEINNRKEGSLGANRQYGGGTNPFLSVSCPRKNMHPTVKPTGLMQYLIRLVTPNGGTVLDPFNGSGSTGKATMYENRERLKDYKYIGVELTPEYLPISRARIEYAYNPTNVVVCEELDEDREGVKKVSYKEISLF